MGRQPRVQVRLLRHDDSGLLTHRVGSVRSIFPVTVTPGASTNGRPVVHASARRQPAFQKNSTKNVLISKCFCLASGIYHWTRMGFASVRTATPVKTNVTSNVVQSRRIGPISPMRPPTTLRTKTPNCSLGA